MVFAAFRRRGVWGAAAPHDPSMPGTPAEAEWHAGLTLYQARRDTQPIAAVTGVPLQHFEREPLSVRRNAARGQTAQHEAEAARRQPR